MTFELVVNLKTATALGLTIPPSVLHDAQHRQRVIRRLRQRAADLGLALVDRGTGEVLEGAVS